MTEMQEAKLIMKESYEILDIGNSEQDYDYHVTFRLGDRCNLECEYCRWYDGENYHNALESIYAIFEFFKEQKFKKVLFYYHGGEAGLHPNVINSLQLLRELEEKTGIEVHIEFQTNLAYTLRRLELIQPLVTKLSISYHYVELANKKLHDHFVDNMKWLILNDHKIYRFDVMLDDVPENELEGFYNRIRTWLEYKYIENSEMIHSFCHYEKNPITKQKHIDFYNKYNRTEQKYKVDDKEYTTNDLFANGLNCKNMLCDAGSKYIVLNADGNVFTCGIEMTLFRLGCAGPIKPITNILNDTNYMKILSIRNKTKIRCKYDYCGGDFYIRKYKE